MEKEVGTQSSPGEDPDTLTRCPILNTSDGTQPHPSPIARPTLLGECCLYTDSGLPKQRDETKTWRYTVIRFLHCACFYLQNFYSTHICVVSSFTDLSAQRNHWRIWENVFGFYCEAGKHRESLAIWGSIWLEVHTYLFLEIT